MSFQPLTLSGRHVRLEPLQAEHAEALLVAASLSRATYGLTVVPADLPGMQAYIARALKEQADGKGLPFVQVLPNGTPIGSTRLFNFEFWEGGTGSAAPRADGLPHALEIGYTWLSEPQQRTGVNTEAKLLLLTHAFEAWNVLRVTLKTDARNARSRANIERVGAKLDGILRAHLPASDGGPRDTAIYSMLREEWPAAKAALQARLR